MGFSVNQAEPKEKQISLMFRLDSLFVFIDEFEVNLANLALKMTRTVGQNVKESCFRLSWFAEKPTLLLSGAS